MFWEELVTTCVAFNRVWRVKCFMYIDADMGLVLITCGVMAVSS